MNSIMVIEPYYACNTWVFDDPRAGLVREPFVSGAPEIISDALARAGISFERARGGFTLTFSAVPFPGHQLQLRKAFDVSGGASYDTVVPPGEPSLRGWLCPALFKYFDRAPDLIYASFAPKPETAA